MGVSLKDLMGSILTGRAIGAGIGAAENAAKSNEPAAQAQKSEPAPVPEAKEPVLSALDGE